MMLSLLEGSGAMRPNPLFAPVAKGTVGLRIPIDRFEMKRKLSQYRHPALADEMERELGSSQI